MSVNRIKYLREASEAESLSWAECAEIQDAFDEIPDEKLHDSRENAMMDDMLNELETQVSPLEWAIYDYVVENFGESEANDPSWDIGSLASHLEKKFNFKEVGNAVASIN
jgi:hypothetical protein